jgi:hypothetical protein
MTSLQNETFDPEKRLLICCARTRMNQEVASQIRDLVAAPLNWDYVLSTAAENSVTPLVGLHLSGFAGDSVPAAHLERLKNLSRANALRCLFLTAELIKIIGLLRSAGIQAVPYKGPILAAQAYGDLTLREYEDLDIILCQRDLAKAHEVMLSLGYRARFPWALSTAVPASPVPGEYNYCDDARRVIVELHTEFTLRHFPRVPDLDDFARRLVSVALGSHGIETFSPEDTLPILCIHGSKDFWERLQWVADISELVQAWVGLDWDEALHRAEQLQAQRMLHLGLALATDLLDAPLPREIQSRVAKDQVAAVLAETIERRLLSRKQSELNAARRFHYRRRMVPGVFAGWRYAMRLAVVPAEEDLQVVRLPRPFAPLYIVLRPFRLVQKYGRASRHA